ncbi:MAG: tRNA (adenosine(37)-N6)-threonylcarbamoyltransferase complex ATPase subunit type 1 TsaE [Firmicutes bacterium]|nr:tRNA (adenosine(37)-N6)-threonylcarbamoyltransferase complex ATPase subunit type 1 TsaE [Candidatus Fiminaster equi]
MLKYKVISKNSEETRSLAAKIVRQLKGGDVVLLTGDLGAGKTMFVSGALNELGYKDHVISPTFNILKCYFEVKPNVFHIDAYRLENQNIDIGLDEFIEGNGITFIEWPVFIEPLIPSRHIEVSIKRIDDNVREIEVSDSNDNYKALFDAFEGK